MELLSQRAFAKEIGRSHVWVSKLVKSGKIPLVDGKIPREEGMKAYEASQQLGYEENRAHGERQRQASKKKTATTKKASSKKESFSDSSYAADDDDMMPSPGNISAEKMAAAFNRAKAAEKTFMAKLREMEYKEKQGLLISKDAVEADAAGVAEELRGMLLSIPPRISPLCEGKEARDIEPIIEDAINEALSALNKSRFAKK